ncbi:MAG: 16S rRNA (adenine(1518)-N(6)/adenine(1519)-N(6))-dimethyltransferase RsmA [Thermoleophilia bacterium]
MNRPLTPLERLRASGIAPERSLGQNFLIDPNILDVIERGAMLDARDVVLEVGPGLGVLTERLVDRCAAVHCVELDRRLADRLRDEFGARPGFQLHMADAVRLDFSSLDPPPDKFVANLPYNVAAPLVMQSFQELPSLRLWCLMVQKEIAERLFASPGAANYGGISVMAQLMAEKLSVRNISSAVFYPQPRVRSSLLVFRRRGAGTEAAGTGSVAGDGATGAAGSGATGMGGTGAADEDVAAAAGSGSAVMGAYTARNFAAVKEIVYAGFGQRRKMLVNSLAGADPAPAPLAGLSPASRRSLVEGLLADLGLAAGFRAQGLTPAEFERLAASLIATVSRPEANGGGHA